MSFSARLQSSLLFRSLSCCLFGRDAMRKRSSCNSLQFMRQLFSHQNLSARRPLMRRICTILFALGVFSQSLHAGEKPPSTDDVRKSIERSLPFIEKEGLAWIKKRDCMSCHVVSYMLWA